jgi:ElaB/YqjD/DUF883 family membrane-anchored ribosome-binding protein
MNTKVEELKLRSLDKLHNLQCSVTDRAKTQATRVQTSMRTSPMKWAGIAAGTGVGIGLISRLLQARSRRALPDLVIVEASC